MSIVWTPREKPASPQLRGRVLPFITRWRAPLDAAQPEPVALEVFQHNSARDDNAARTATRKEPIPITVRVRVRY